MRLKFIPTRRIEWLRLPQIEGRIANGRLQKYDSKKGEIEKGSGDEWWFKNTPGWNRESVDVKEMARELHAEYQQKVMERQNVSATWENGEGDRNKAKTYAMIACLRRFKFDNQHVSSFVVQRDGVAEYKYIDAKLVRQMETMIQGLRQIDDFRNKEEYEYFDFNKFQWEMIGFNFERQKKERRRRTVGFYPFINLGNEDMSKFGIYNEFNLENYKTNCVVETFSNVLNAKETALLESVLQTWTMPIGQLRHVAEMFNLKIWVHRMDKTRMPPIGDGKRQINVLIADEHLMFREDNLEDKIRALTVRPMTNEEFNEVVRLFETKPVLDAITYPDCAKRLWEQDPKNDSPAEDGGEGEEFRRLILNRYGLDRLNFSTVAQMGFTLLQSRVKDVCQLRGFLAEFIRQCQCRALLGTPHNNYPIDVQDDLVQLDQHGSYASAYANFEGIPKGVPRVISDWESAKRDATHYYVQVEVRRFRCRHRDDPHPIVEEGAQFWDKTWLEMVERHYDVEYDFVCGYQFVQGCASIREITEELWELRNRVKGKPEEKYVKELMNTWWGRSISEYKAVSEKVINRNALNAFIRSHPLVYSHRRDGDKIRMRTVRPILAPWQIPHFGVNVKSWARKEMQENIYRLIDAGENVWYSNTDSLLVRREAVRLIKVGDGLGEFKVEAEGVRFICVGPKTRLLIQSDGELKNTWGKRDVEWFEKKMRKMLEEQK
jgi:hypothetical protein